MARLLVRQEDSFGLAIFLVVCLSDYLIIDFFQSILTQNLIKHKVRCIGKKQGVYNYDKNKINRYRC